MRSTLALALLLAGCWETPAAPPPIGYESDIDACSDSRDNDRDGRVDCVDTDCLALSLCNEVFPLIPPNEPDEDSFELCTNRVDDDDDGNFDCGDRTCGQFMELCCSTEFTDDKCQNGIDDDDNGYTDCQDFGCSQGLFVTVCDAEAVCDDGEDNDDDGRADCLDEDCALNDACRGPIEDDCANGADDDMDGATDCDDGDCAGTGSCVMPENTAMACADGIDNDGDDFVDCEDFDCSRSMDPDVMALCATTGEPEETLDACSDGIDNDMNGFTDCADFGCSRSTDPAILEHCAERTENTFDRCTDGIDNDGNGYADCADFSCRDSFEFLDAAMTRLRSPCLESGATPSSLESIRRTAAFPDDVAVANAQTSCSDGMDNDADGFVDCDDWDCNWNPLLIEPDGRRFCERTTGLLLCR